MPTGKVQSYRMGKGEKLIRRFIESGDKGWEVTGDITLPTLEKNLLRMYPRIFPKQIAAIEMDSRLYLINKGLL